MIRGVLFLMVFVMVGCSTKIEYRDRFVAVRPHEAYFQLQDPPLPLDFEHVQTLVYQNDIVGLQRYLAGEWLSVLNDVTVYRNQITEIKNYVEKTSAKYEALNDESK